MNSRDLIAMLRKAGFELASIKGSHHKFRKGELTVVVPHPKKDLPLGTVREILKRAGLREPAGAAARRTT